MKKDGLYGYVYDFSVYYDATAVDDLFNNPFSKLCVPYVVKNMNIKVFNLMLRTD